MQNTPKQSKKRPFPESGPVRPKEVQAWLNCGHDKFWRDVRRGVLPPVRKLGGMSYQLAEEVRQLVYGSTSEAEGRHAG